MSSKYSVISLEKNGELTYDHLHSMITRRYASDSLFERPLAPYIMILICGSVDCGVFYSLFDVITPDDTLLKVLQILGFFFGYDIVPVYLGNHLKKFNQKMNKDRFILLLGILSFVIACSINVVLRVSTMDLISVDGDDGSIVDVIYQDDVDSLDNSENGRVFSLTVMGVLIPFVTSLGSFFISYLCSDPLRNQQRMLEELCIEKKDDIRRIQAHIDELRDIHDSMNTLMEEDEGQYQQMLNYHRALVCTYCNYVRVHIAEHIQDPAAHSALSEDIAPSILERLDSELNALSNHPKKTDDKEK